MFSQQFLEDLKKSLYPYTAMDDILRRQNAIFATMGAQLSESIAIAAARVNFPIQLPEIYSSLQIDMADWIKAVQVSTDVFSSIRSSTILSDALSRQMHSMTESLSLMGKHLAADLAAINLSALNLSSLGVFDNLAKLLEYHKDSAEAFKSAGWTIAPSMNRELREKVVLLHQQNKTRHISQVILGYYHRNDFEKLRNAVATWETNPLFSSRMHIFRAALKAHCDKTYALSVPALLPQIEGVLNQYVITNKLEAKLGKIRDVYNAVIGDPDEYPLPSWAIVNTLLYQLQTNTFTFTDFEAEFKKASSKRKTTRHTVLHGIAINYDKPVHSLKAFVLLDALSSLETLDAE